MPQGSGANDIFISWAHMDGKAFVSKFKQRLESLVNAKYGRNPGVGIWMDNDHLPSGILWNDEINDRVRECRLFLPIISPGWLKSHWCGIEWRERWDEVESDFIDKALGNQTRIIPVALEIEERHKAKLADYQHLQINHHFKSVMPDNEFDKVVDGLAKEIADLLDRLDELIVEERAHETLRVDQSQIFLGFALTSSMRRWQKQLKNELHSSGFRTCEMHFDPSLTAPEVRKQVREALKDCVGAVHFLDSRGGPVLPGDGSNLSLIELQCDEAMRCSPEDTNHSYWTGPDNSSEWYQRAIGDRRYSSDSINAFIRKFLKELRDAQSRKAVTATASVLMGPSQQAKELFAKKRPVICLICESGDWEVAEDIRTFFSNKPLEWVVSVPDRGVEQAAISGEYSRIFRENEIFLFYWGSGDQKWQNYNYEGLIAARKHEGHAIRDPLALACYVASEKKEYKERFNWPYHLWKRYDRFDPRALEDFIKDVETRTGLV